MRTGRTKVTRQLKLNGWDFENLAKLTCYILNMMRSRRFGMKKLMMMMMIIAIMMKMKFE
uniref:Alternative protein ERMN n=1 Tax=Homo sapiens TaxID=9606 RepID=L8E8L0_HUMAN|nr:alternative protein ERMN [Homo sapiens]